MSAKPRSSISESALLICGVVIISATFFLGSFLVWNQFSSAVTKAVQYPSSWRWISQL